MISNLQQINAQQAVKLIKTYISIKTTFYYINKQIRLGLYFRCSECPQVFTQSSNLTNHLQTVRSGCEFDKTSKNTWSTE